MNASCDYKGIFFVLSGVVADEFDLESIVVPEPRTTALGWTAVVAVAGLVGVRGRDRMERLRESTPGDASFEENPRR